MSMGRVFAVVPVLLLGMAVGLAAAPGRAKHSAPSSRIDESKPVDLTYDFDSSTIYWPGPTAQPFRWEKESWGRTAKGNWYAAARYAASEHGGMHIDSPIHFAEGKATVDELPVTQLCRSLLEPHQPRQLLQSHQRLQPRRGHHQPGVRFD
ncbi:MAG: cyclase family protein [Terriglobales bacterium]